MSERKPVLEATCIEAQRGKNRVLRGLSLSVYEGEIVGLLGPSGAGKSTLFEALAGELPLTAGHVRLSGRAVGTAPLFVRARWGLSYLPQGPSVLHDLTVEENLLTFGRLSDTPLPRPRLDGLIDRVGLAERRTVRARDLSGGERRRLEIARALLRRPALLLADEPFAGMDPRAVSHIAALLRTLAGEGLAILVSDHHATEVLALAQRALLLADGSIDAESPAAAFAAHPAVSSRYLPDLPGSPHRTGSSSENDS